MKEIAILYHTTYGHTKKLAEAVYAGAMAATGVKVHLFNINADGNLDDKAWEILSAVDAIVFGSPTYMGGPSWQFKKFAETSSKYWSKQAWKNKLAAGFTNSATINGDKLSTLYYFFTFAMQHSMLWVGTGLMPANTKSATRNDINYLGSFSGAMAQSPADSSPEEGPLPGDLETAKLFGKRVAETALALELRKG